METPKYYTPQIEEFHIGFEYESHLGLKYEKETINTIQDIMSLACIISIPNMIRVKHLDLEDIKAEGWIVKVWSNDSGYLNKISDGEEYTFGFHNSEYMTISLSDNGNTVMLFQGKIKNKSELKRIMQQIGINQ